MEEVLVSIYCMVYNHEKFITDALNGFVGQKCNFRYEVIVHDDASTDKTAEIIREYERKYPEIIKPIYQKENQYSKQVNILFGHVLPRATGKYIACCEGDDYWVDPYKLQKQVDYMESHPDCTFCFTNGYIEDVSNHSAKRPFIPYSAADAHFYQDHDRDYTLDNFYELEFIPTASFLFPRKTLESMRTLYLARTCPTGDLRLRLYMCSQGYAHYIHEATCVYRENVPNSAMTRWKKDDRRKVYKRAKEIADMITDLDTFTGAVYTDGLSKFLDTHTRSMLFHARSFAVFQDERCWNRFLKCSPAEKCKVVLKIFIPEPLYQLVHNLLKK